jgi:hypothetical protein
MMFSQHIAQLLHGCCADIKPNHMGNGIQPAVAPSDMVGKKKENP